MSDTIDLNGFEEQRIPFSIKTVLTCTVRLDKKTILDTLHCRKIYLAGHYYRIPEQKLIECLRLKQFGETQLELERIPEKKDKRSFKVTCIHRWGYTFITPGEGYTVTGEINLKYEIVDDQKKLNYYPKDCFKIIK